MDQKEQILHYHRIDGLSLREISRRVGLNRKTVTRYVREYEASVREDPEEGLDICLASKPKYPARNVECTRMTEPVCAEIEYWLQDTWAYLPGICLLRLPDQTVPVPHTL